MGGQTHSPPVEDRWKWLSQRERQLATLATRQHGVISRAQLLEAGISAKAIEHRLERGRLHPLHQGVYLLGHRRTNRRGYWLAAVLACGRGALLSHESAAALWGLIGARGGAIHLTSSHGRAGRPGIALHKGRLHAEDRAKRDGIPVTSVARTIFDLAETHDDGWMRGVFEEADRLRILRLAELRRVCDRGAGRRGLGLARRLAEEAIAAENDPASFLENLFFTFCREQRLPRPLTNVPVLGFEVDALWLGARVIVELDGWRSHRHRAAFERDRIRDADHAVAGYRVIRVTYRRLKREPAVVADQLRELLTTGA